MSLADEFALLADDDDGRPVVDGTRLDHGLSGALLLELALAGKVEVVDRSARAPGRPWRCGTASRRSRRR